MVTDVLEGTWEEIAKHANRLAGKKLRVEVLEDEPKPEPNRKALEVIQRVIERQKGMRETGGESAVDIIRRGRAGEMFGYESTE